MSEANEYALAMDMAIPILFWLGASEPRKKWRLAFRLMMFGCAVVVVGTRSRSGLLGLVTAGLVLAAFSKHKLLLVVGIVVAVVLLLLFGPQGALQRYKTIPTAVSSDGSVIGRLQAWKAAIRMTEAHPITGVGPRNFLYEFHNYSSDFPRVTHNVVFDMLSETGIPGCLIFLAMIFSAIGEMYALRLKALAHPEMQQLAVFCQILMAVFIVYLVPNMFINRQDFDLMYQILGVEAGLAALLHQKMADQPIQSNFTDSEVIPLWAKARDEEPDRTLQIPRLDPELN